MKRPARTLPAQRIVFLQSVMIIVTLLVIGRFFQVAVLEHAKAVEAAKNQYTVKQVIEAKRGKIYLRDLNGGPPYPVALNIESFSVVADPFLMKEPEKVAADLAAALQLSIEEVLEKLKVDTRRYAVIKKKITKDEAAAIEKLNLIGVTVQALPARYYPEGVLAAQVVGFVDAEGEGRYGIEGFFNEDLKGYDGSLIGEKDAKRRIIAKDKTAQPKDGNDIVLTIDHNIQFVVEEKLRQAVEKYEADSGSVVLMDVKTGAILAMANEPSFDLNKYNTVPNEKQDLFLNKAASLPWEPGSVFKTFTVAAGLDLGLFEPETRLELGCFVKIDGYEIRNAENKCYNQPSIIDILAESINLGTIAIADQLGNDNFAKYMADFGFGSKTGIEFQAESTGKIPALKQWRNVHRATFAFGQGLSVTPIQLVNAYAAIANEGKLMRPYLVEKRLEGGKEIITQPQEIRQVLKDETVPKITLLLEKVVTDGHGKRAGVKGYKVAGKTGTAQVVGENGSYEENAHIGTFAGFFPSNEPRFALVVKLDKPKAVEFAESSAAPTFSEIAQWLLHYAKVPPSQPIE